MTQIICLSGRKQAGKNTCSNFIHGKILKERGEIQDFRISEDGKLLVLTSNEFGVVDWGVLELENNQDPRFIEYATRNMWPYVKQYLFADSLKWLCIDLFGIPRNIVYGSDEDKNTLFPHLRWENMPGVCVDGDMYKALCRQDGRVQHILRYHEPGPMSAREFMQHLGTEIMRKIYGNVWVDNTLKHIREDGSLVAIVSDLRFPNEADAMLDAGAKIIRLKRKPLDDNHYSETALDDYDESRFQYVLENGADGYSIGDLCNDINEIYERDIR